MFFKNIKDIWQNKTLVRSLMHIAIDKKNIKGLTLDIGGGNNPEYWNILQKDDNVKIINLDLKNLKEQNSHHIDLESDTLPYNDVSIDTVLMFNILEHIYNYRHLTKEVARVLRSGGEIIGFVPFLVNYHPNPHDYFRYTKESLLRIFEEAGLKDIKISGVGRGPFSVNYNNIVLSVPRIIRVIIFPFYWALDTIFLWFRPNITQRYPLGYLFICKK